MRTQFNLNIIKSTLFKTWSRKTCYPPDAKYWNKDKPYYGQCAVTALIIQDYLGGDLLYNEEKHHYWNKLPDGEIVDLTIEQFEKYEPFNEYEIKKRIEIINETNEIKVRIYSRYIILKKKVDKLLQPQLFLIEEIK